MKQRAYVLIQAEKGQSDTVAAELSNKQGILKADQVFGPYDVVALIEADSLDGLVVIVRNEIAAADHVVRTETLIVRPTMKSVRKRWSEPLRLDTLG